MIVLYILLGLLAAYLLLLSICALAVDTRREYDTHSPFYRRLLNSATAIALRIMRIRVHVTGTEKIPAGTKPLFVCNHRSNFDPIITWHALKKWNISFISKPENFKIPIFGRVIRRCCFLPIDRQNPRNAIKTIQKAAQLLENTELSVGVYPEGTRNHGDGLLPFHNGVFKVAQKANAPIVILTVAGTEQVHKNYPFHHSDVYLNVVTVLPAEEVRQNRTEAIGEIVRTEIENALAR